MLDTYITTVWDSSIAYSFSIRRATVAGTTVTVTQPRHRLLTGDPIVTTALSPAYSAFQTTTTVIVLDENKFTFNVPVPPGQFPMPKAGADPYVVAKFPSYSQLLELPHKVRLTVPTGSTVDVEAYEEEFGAWKNEKTLHNSDGLVELVFLAKWKEVRLHLTSGSSIPTTSALHESAPPQPAATNTYYLPEFTGGGSGSLTPVGTPGTYDIVTTNIYGQVISGTTGQPGIKFTESALPPASPNLGDQWLNTDTAILYTYIQDSDSYQWVDITSGVLSGSSGGSGGTQTITATNITGGTVYKGQPVRLISDTTFDLACGDALRKGVIGLVADDSVLNGADATILISGILTATSGQWDAATGGSGGLSNDGVAYFLSFTNPGQLTSTVNTSIAPSGSFLVEVGYSLSTTEFMVLIEPPIQI